MKRPISISALSGAVLALASCAPKALVVRDTPAPARKNQPQAAETRASLSATASAAAPPSKKAGGQATATSAPVPQAAAQTTPARKTSKTPLPAGGGDSLRLPDMLGLPGDKELKSTGSSGSGGAVISRPPSE
ncbi:MAG: hypothetical protein QM680_01750 [Luteolibacter sp.]